MFVWMEEYCKHAVLNLGQALLGVRFLFTHPDVDRIAPPGTVRHMVRAAALRLRRVGNDLFFAILPPHWHHSHEELETLHALPARRWFLAGYSPCRFTETGALLAREDVVLEPRRDPRCKDE